MKKFIFIVTALLVIENINAQHYRPLKDFQSEEYEDLIINEYHNANYDWFGTRMVGKKVQDFVNEYELPIKYLKLEKITDTVFNIRLHNETKEIIENSSGWYSIIIALEYDKYNFDQLEDILENKSIEEQLIFLKDYKIISIGSEVHMVFK
ncbi:MAG: hypothetical protein LIO79_04100 [Rikenellaceae bacterium]|nr:hypothetical protein [Rikenellaceae bacterium]